MDRRDRYRNPEKGYSRSREKAATAVLVDDELIEDEQFAELPSDSIAALMMAPGRHDDATTVADRTVGADPPAPPESTPPAPRRPAGGTAENTVGDTAEDTVEHTVDARPSSGVFRRLKDRLRTWLGG